MHRAECLCVEESLKDLGTALAQRIVEALFRSRAETVQRNAKSRNSNPWHMCVLVAPEIHAIACLMGSHCETRIFEADFSGITSANGVPRDSNSESEDSLAFSNA